MYKLIGILAVMGWALGIVPVAPAAHAGDCVVNTSTPTYINGKRIDQQCDENGNLKTTATLNGGGDASAANQTTMIGHLDGVEATLTAIDGRVDGLETLVTSTNTKLDTAITALQLIDDDQTGTSNKHFVTAGLTEDETEVKATAGRLIAVQASNSAATVAYLRCANLTAANTTPGTSTVFWGMAIPGATTGAGVVANFGPMGIAFSTALTCWVVGGKAETDVAEVGANDVQVNIQYK